MATIKKPVCSKNGKICLAPEGLDSCKSPPRRSARLREKNVNQKVDYSSIRWRQSPKIAKIRENRRQGQLQLESKGPRTKKGKKSHRTKCGSPNQPQPISRSRQVRSDCEQPLTRDTQEITQRVNHNKGKPIENWLSTVPLSLENLVDPFQKRKSENMPPNTRHSSHVDPISTRITPSAGTKHTPSAGGVRATDFRDSLCEHNIFINGTDASKELMERAKRIITDKELFPEMSDDLAQKLAVTAQNLATGTEDDIVEELGRVLIPTKMNLPHQNLQRISNRLWSNAVEIPPDPDELAMPPILPKPKPDLVFGYSKIAFNNNQLKAMKLLKGQLRENYAMPDGKVRFPFLVIEFKSQAAGGTHFTATNQLANAGAVAMEGTLQLARRISAGGNIDFDQPQFFSLSIDHSTAIVNVHWLSRNDENGAFCFNMKHLLQRFLDADGLKAVDRAVKGILHYGVNKRLKQIQRELDTFAQNTLKEKAIIKKGNLASGAPPEEQGQQQQPGNRKNDDSLANRQQVPLQIKRPCRAQESIADDEDELA